MSGNSNAAADATSRHPASTLSRDSDTNVRIEQAIVASIQSSTLDEFVISWNALMGKTSTEMEFLLNYIRDPNMTIDETNSSKLKPYWPYREAFYELDGVILYDDRVVVPPSLRPLVLQTLHSAHQGTSAMEGRARQMFFWPGYTTDIAGTRAKCKECNNCAPSQPHLPPAAACIPTTPFEFIVADYFEMSGHHYLVIADRLSGWSEVFLCKPGSAQSGAAGLIKCLINSFSCYGVPTELSSDGGKEFTAGQTIDFLKKWGVTHRLSSVAHPQSNGRAEVAVKTVKRMLMSNIGYSGSLNNERFLTAMLQLRNTPDPECGLSPAQVLFGRPLRDAFSFVNRLEKFGNTAVRPAWRDAWKQKESALRHRCHRNSEVLKEHCKQLPPLTDGDSCYIQNQVGNYPNRWDRSGTVVQCLDHDSYLVKVDGSGRLSRRNRQFLRKFEPMSPKLNYPLASVKRDDYPHRDSSVNVDSGISNPTCKINPAPTGIPNQVEDNQTILYLP